MSNLPAKPVDSLQNDRPDSRFSSDDLRERRLPRPTAPAAVRYDRGDVYVPRARADSYVAPPFDERRDHDPRRRDYNSDWNRDHTWESRPRENRARDRGPRFGDPEHDRNRREFDRDRFPERGNGYPPRDRYRDEYIRRDPRPLSPRRDSSSSFRRSRSPRDRWVMSSPPRYRGMGMPRPRSRSPPPPKRMRLGNHSIDTSSYSAPRLFESDRRSQERSRSPRRRSRSRIRSPFPTRREATPPATAMPMNEDKTLPQQSPYSEELPTLSSESEHHSRDRALHASPMPKTEEIVVKAEVSPTSESPSRAEAKRSPEREIKQDVQNDVKLRERSPSPPRQPRLRGPQPPAPLHHRYTSRSPPRGPRNHPKGNTTPTGPASHHPPGPRGQRRPYQNTAAPHAPPTAQVPAPSPAPALPAASQNHDIPISDPELKVPFPEIPVREPRPSITRELDLEMARVQAHRAHLASEYTQIAKLTRRALHELDTAAIDLRAAELRRKVADSHVEKARAGILGIDAAPIDSPVP